MNCGEVASIATLVMFGLFFYGKIKVTRRVSKRQYDKLEVLNISDDELEQYKDLDNFIDLGGLQLIKLTSTFKIDSIEIYDIEYYDHSGDESKYRSKLRTSVESIEPQDCLYLYLELGETMPKFSISINYIDHSIATFLISEDRRNGNASKDKYKMKAGLKTFFYYLLS